MDTCDRCGRERPISVGHECDYGYDGLCDDCLDAMPALCCFI